MVTQIAFPISLLAALAAVLVSGAAPAEALDVEPWDRVLRSYAVDGGVDYRGLAGDGQAMQDLEQFLGSVAEMPESEPLASWLNAYNALVVRSVIEHYPVDSVRSVPGFFDGRRHRVAGRLRTLDDLEHRVIRPRFPDARVHAALNCGARSCPPLHPRAFRQESLDATLDGLARGMVAGRRHVRVRDGQLAVSRLFDWFAEDFERDGRSVLGWIRRYDAGGKTAGLDAGVAIRHISYDWSLNEGSRR